MRELAYIFVFCVLLISAIMCYTRDNSPQERCELVHSIYMGQCMAGMYYSCYMSSNLQCPQQEKND